MAKNNNQQFVAENKINSGALKKDVILVRKGHTKVVTPKDGIDYQIAIENSNQQLNTDFDVIAQKKSQDLIVLLEDNTTVIFDNYFPICADLSCLVSLPSGNSLYHIIDSNSVTLDGFELLYFYGDKDILSDIASNQVGVLDFLNQSHAEVESGGFSYTSLGGIAVAALSLGGGGSDGSSILDGFSITGNIVAGQVSSASGYTIKAYGDDGEELKTSVTIKDDGSFSIRVNENYTGVILLRLQDSNTAVDYKSEGSGKDQDLSVDLRTVAQVSNANTTININPLLEIATRKLLDDIGGDKGSSKIDLSDIVTGSQTLQDVINNIYSKIAKAFALGDIDIASISPVAVNAKKDNEFLIDGSDVTNAQKSIAYILSAISGMEQSDKNGSVNKTTNTVIQELVNGISSNGVLDQGTKDNFVAGVEQSNSQTNDNYVDPNAALKNNFTNRVGNISISNDTAFSDTDSDFITKASSQTIQAELDVVLNNEKLWGSVDDENWIDITSMVTSTSVEWTQALVEGEHSIRFAITKDTITNSTQVDNNIEGNIASQHYTLDTIDPNAVSIEKIIGDQGIIKDNGATNDSSVTMRVTLDKTGDGAHQEGDKIQVNKGSSYFKEVSLSLDDIEKGYKDISLTLASDEEYTFSVKAIDEVGNSSGLSSEQTLTRDRSISRPTLALEEDTGVSDSDGITQNKKLIISGLEEGATVQYILDGSNLWITSNTVVSSNGRISIELSSDTTYNAGNIKVKQTDKAGNTSSIATNPKWIIDNTSAKYDTDEDVLITRVLKEDGSVERSQITLTFTQDLSDNPNFDKSSFSIYIGSSTTKSIVDSVNIIGNQAQIIIQGDIKDSDTGKIKLTYAQSTNSRALQDKAGNSIADISETEFNIDQTVPLKPTISNITDNKGDKTGEVSSSNGNTITDDSSLTIRLSILSTGAVEGDIVQFYNGVEKLFAKTLTQVDIDLGYKEFSFNFDTSSDGKSYELTAKIIDQGGNLSDASDVRSFTVDSTAATLSLTLTDTGTSASDYITSDITVTVGNIETDATWKYSTDNGKNWTVGNTADNSGEASFELEKNHTYESGDIQVKQTDKADNESTYSLNRQVVTDDIAPEYQSIRVSGNSVIITFDQELYSYTQTITKAVNAFKVNGNSVGKVSANGNEVILEISGIITDINSVVVTYSRPLTSYYQLKDRAGNLVSDLRIGSSADDTDTTGHKALIGNDTHNTLLIGNAGNDEFIAGNGSDIFDYNATTDGNDTISDFTMGTDVNKDILDLKDLLQGYDSSASASTLSNFITLTDNGSNTVVNVDAAGDGSGTFNADVSITLDGITGVSLQTMIDDGNLVLS